MAGQLLLICGSVRAGSSNAAVLRTAGLLAPDGVAVSSYDELAVLPHFNPDFDSDSDGENLPAPVARLRSRLGEARAVLFSTPEYAGALPGSLKNLLDWSIGGGEMSGKPVGWINCAWGGATRAAGAYAELRTVLTYADAAIVEQACVQVPVTRAEVGPDGLVADAAIREQLAAAVAALVTAGRAG